MKRLTMLLLAGVMALGISTGANASVLTFDDIGGGSAITAAYGGLNWSNMYHLNGNTYTPAGSGYTAGLVSGDYVAYNAYGDSATVSGSIFDFNGAYLTGAWNEGLNVTVTGYLNGVQAYQQTVVTTATAPTWFDFNFFGINELEFDSFGGTDTGLGGGNHFAMDNFTFNEVAPVPEPSTMILLGAGLLGLAGYGRNRFGKKS